ncbi:MAG: hypothetical protein H8E00_01055 [Deltaproteobacteria bacterium]|nr:hypothetical protein [Deltaproteobacteria bacterium]
MKRSIFVLSLLLIILPDLTFGAENFVTSKILSISDVKNYAQMRIRNKLRMKVKYNIEPITILGIHQKGNEARVFHSWGDVFLTFDIIRFNSGKWFEYENNTFVVK